MDETRRTSPGNQEPQPSIDEAAHRFYLDKIGLSDLENLDPDYADNLRELSVRQQIAAINELAAELPESQAGIETTELKLAMSQTEKRLATEITDRIARAEATRHGSPAEAVARTYKDIVNHRNDANYDIFKLNMAFESPENADSYISAERVRTSHFISEVIAKYLQAINSAKRNFWPRKDDAEFAEQEKFARGMAIEICLNADNPTIERLVGNIYKLAENRFRFWTQGKTIADATRQVRQRVISDPQRTIGGLFPLRESPLAEGEHGKLFEDQLQPPEEVITEPAQEGPTFAVPASASPAVRAHLADLKERDEVVARRVEQGFTNRFTEIRNLFRGQPERDDEGRVIGIEKPEDAPKRGVHSNKVHKKKRSRPIRPSERKKPGYDHERDPSNPWPF